jgi:phosphoglycerate dehydrogenase-like enzyme
VAGALGLEFLRADRAHAARRSRGLTGAAELAALPAHAFVINAARGGIIDETALHDAR